eukprot:gnl/Carplike_NY0171/2197_a2959_512.p1 GENE.gnl/Carplike_NY0171/2197_a2959_512~~gnl/Carplike_NY0171/2197_a2959_512.p1  ORF type:complete len:521 (-),score=173.16 gnl/Carplike_NY0171/2197_a2959_512:947-2428(-)
MPLPLRKYRIGQRYMTAKASLEELREKETHQKAALEVQKKKYDAAKAKMDDKIRHIRKKCETKGKKTQDEIEQEVAKATLKYEKKLPKMKVKSEGESIIFVTNEEQTRGGVKGIYTEKIFNLQKSIPKVLQLLAGKKNRSKMMAYEYCWNAYPYSKTWYSCPLLKHFFLSVESYHETIGGEQRLEELRASAALVEETVLEHVESSPISAMTDESIESAVSPSSTASTSTPSSSSSSSSMETSTHTFEYPCPEYARMAPREPAVFPVISPSVCHLQNALLLPADHLSIREVVPLDIGKDPLPKKKDIDLHNPTLVQVSEARTQSGDKYTILPLVGDWQEARILEMDREARHGVSLEEAKHAITTVYKIVKADIKAFGMQKKIEKTIQGSMGTAFLEYHKKLFCWGDEWMSMDESDVEKMEEEVHMLSKAILERERVDDIIKMLDGDDETETETTEKETDTGEEEEEEEEEEEAPRRESENEVSGGVPNIDCSGV